MILFCVRVFFLFFLFPGSDVVASVYVYRYNEGVTATPDIAVANAATVASASEQSPRQALGRHRVAEAYKIWALFNSITSDESLQLCWRMENLDQNITHCLPNIRLRFRLRWLSHSCKTPGNVSDFFFEKNAHTLSFPFFQFFIYFMCFYFSSVF